MIGLKISIINFCTSDNGIQYLAGQIEYFAKQKNVITNEKQRLGYILESMRYDDYDACDLFHRFIPPPYQSSPKSIHMIHDDSDTGFNVLYMNGFIYVCDYINNTYSSLSIDGDYHHTYDARFQKMLSYAQTWGYSSDACHRPFIYPVVV